MNAPTTNHRGRVPVLALDIDGVLGPVGRRRGEAYEVLPGVGWQGSIAYVPTIIDRIARLHASGCVEVQWLTSWEDEANEAWAQVGFGPFRTLRSRDVPSGIRWWKAEHVRRLLADGRRVIWIDDEIGDHVGLARQNPQPKRLHLVCPPPHIGVTHADLDGVDAWLTAAALPLAEAVREPL